MIGISKIERCIWKINLTSQNGAIKSKAKELFSVLDKFAEYIEPSKARRPEKEIERKIDEINNLRDELIEEMNKDINRFL